MRSLVYIFSAHLFACGPAPVPNDALMDGIVPQPGTKSVLAFCSIDDCGSITISGATSSFILARLDPTVASFPNGVGALLRLSLEPSPSGGFINPAEGGRTLKLAPDVEDTTHCTNTFGPGSAFSYNGSAFWSVSFRDPPCDSGPIVHRGFILEPGADSKRNISLIPSDFDGRLVLDQVRNEIYDFSTDTSANANTGAIFQHCPQIRFGGLLRDQRQALLQCPMGLPTLTALYDYDAKSITPIETAIRLPRVVGADGTRFYVDSARVLTRESPTGMVDSPVLDASVKAIIVHNDTVFVQLANLDGIANTGKIVRLAASGLSSVEELVPNANVPIDLETSMTASDDAVFWIEKGASSGDTTVSGNLFGIVYLTL